MKAAFYTLGCKVNQYETQLMRESLSKAGYTLTNCEDIADVYIVNSCTVTAASHQKARQAMRAFKRKNPDCLIVLCGCMSQAYPAQSEKLKLVDIIIGNTDHEHLPEHIAKAMTTRHSVIDVQPHFPTEPFEAGTITHFDDKTRAEIKIEDGCNRFCAYCAIPYARGRVRSKPIDTLRKEVETLAGAGFKEIVLVGINLSAYRDGQHDLADAVACAASGKGIQRVRLGSLEPDHITDNIIARLKQIEHLCAHFHISLQSGCDKTLQAMNRHYTADEYRTLCAKLRAAFPDCAITTDVMVGFPGESEEDFQTSFDFVKEMRFERIHVFPYSVREGTKAATMPGQISKHLKQQRAAAMIALGKEMSRNFYRSQIGKTMPILFETKKGAYHIGHAQNYLSVKVLSDAPLEGLIKPVQMQSTFDEGCIGTILNTDE